MHLIMMRHLPCAANGQRVMHINECNTVIHMELVVL